MPIAILSKDRAILQIVPDGYKVDGDTITTPGGSSWTVAGATQHATITQAEARKYTATLAPYLAAQNERAEVQRAKRDAWTAAHGATPDAAAEASIDAELPAEPDKPVAYQDESGKVTPTKPKVAREAVPR